MSFGMRYTLSTLSTINSYKPFHGSETPLTFKRCIKLRGLAAQKGVGFEGRSKVCVLTYVCSDVDSSPRALVSSPDPDSQQLRVDYITATLLHLEVLKRVKVAHCFSCHLQTLPRAVIQKACSQADICITYIC